MGVRTEILPSAYHDSVVLMRVAASLRARPGIREAAAVMGTPANLALLEQAGLLTAESRTARPDDLILAVDADSETEAEAALAAGRDLLAARRHAAGGNAGISPRTLDGALRRLPDANLAAISVPGAYAAREAMRALRRGLHVFLFSDHVPLADEAALKQEALRRGLLCMGPDCGTAYLGGTGLGFFNLVPRGRVGCVAASGTGLQAVACRLAALGEGLSHAIGVGGRDLSAEVGGAMTRYALGLLAADPATEAIVVIGKPPHPDVLPHLEAVIDAIPKTVVVCCLGATGRHGAAPWVATLDDAADAVVAALHRRAWAPRLFSDPGAVRARLARNGGPNPPTGGGILGLYTGGTLAHEARLVVAGLLSDAGPHRILDLGDDAYTVERPHPMIDPTRRAELIAQAGASPDIGAVLVDVVLGRGAHPDPAGPVAEAIRRARSAAARDGRRLASIATVVGTPRDPQGLAGQVVQLEAAGVEVLPTNAEAARFAALVVQPALSAQLLGGAA